MENAQLVLHREIESGDRFRLATRGESPTRSERVSSLSVLLGWGTISISVGIWAASSLIKLKYRADQRHSESTRESFHL